MTLTAGLLTGCGSSARSAATATATLSFDRSILLEDSAKTSANVSLGDLNGDGHLDLVLVEGRHWPLLDPVLLGDGAGGFQSAGTLGSVPDRSYSGLLVDMDHDGDLDVVVSNDDPDPKVVYVNDGTGHFQVASRFGRPEWSTRYVTVGELNGDSFPDVVVANRTGGDSGFDYVCLGVPGARFSDDCDGFARESATTITMADFDGDGRTDLAVPHRDGGQSRIYFNDGSGGFVRSAPFGPPDAHIRTAAAADLDGDGALDFAVIDEERGPAIYAGRPDGTFADAMPLGEPGPHPYAIRVADLDGDGRADIIVGYVKARPVAYFNQGGFGFTAVPFGDAEGTAYGFSVGDVDEDGVMDIAMARSGAPNVLYFGAR